MDPGETTPFICAVAEPIETWAKMVWENAESVTDLQLTLLAESHRLVGQKRAWSRVRGPTGVYLLSLLRINWTAQSCVEIRTAEGDVVDLRRESPAAVRRLAEKAAEAVLLRSLNLWGQDVSEADHLLSRLVPRLEPLRAMFRQPGTFGGARAMGILWSTVIGAQWPQARLHEAGLVATAECQLCKEEPGTLVHRSGSCQFTAAWRSQWWSGNQPDSGHALWLGRGLAPSLAYLLPPPTLDHEIHCTEGSDVAHLEGDVFTDGSGKWPKCQARRRVGFGVAKINEAGDLTSGWYGPAPLRMQEVRGAEAYAVYVALLWSIGKIVLFIDCQDTIDHLDRGRVWATRASNLFAGLWAAIWTLLEDRGCGEHGVQWRKVKAHATADDVQRGLITAHERDGSKAADKLAKQGADCHELPSSVCKAMDALDDQVKLWGAFLGQLGARLGAEWPRDSEGRRQRHDPTGRSAASGNARGRRAAAASAARDAGRDDWGRRLSWVVGHVPTEDERPHALAVVSAADGTPLTVCTHCWAYSGERLRLLGKPCQHHVGGRAAQKSCLCRQLGPQSGTGWLSGPWIRCPPLPCTASRSNAPSLAADIPWPDGPPLSSALALAGLADLST